MRAPRARGVTLVQVAPSSRVTCTRPSSVEAQISPGRWAESARQAQVACTSAPAVSWVSGPPEWPWRDGSFRLRSGEMHSQLAPSLRVRNTRLPPAYSVLGSPGAKTSG